MNLSDLQAAVQKLDIVPDGRPPKEYPPVCPGRVAHIDADFLAYMASAEPMPLKTKMKDMTPEEVVVYVRSFEENRMTLEHVLYKADVMIEDKMRECAASMAVLHLTPTGSTKGGRYDTAIQKEYQAKRESEKPRYLNEVREHMANKTGRIQGKSWDNAEADDGMAQAAWAAHREGTSTLVVVATKDKDLNMVPGLHLDWDTGIIEGASDTFGSIQINVKFSKAGTKIKKLVGYGTKFFWAQMLMGDPVDNIQGVPFATINGKRKKVGLVGAYELLEEATTDSECLRIVTEAYKENEYAHWLTDEPVGWADVFWSEAQMLWMQRTPGEVWDVKNWVKEITR